jgi:hypothetical protein
MHLYWMFGATMPGTLREPRRGGAPVRPSASRVRAGMGAPRFPIAFPRGRLKEVAGANILCAH